MEKRNLKCKMKNEKVNILQFTLCTLPFALLVISGCVAFELGGEIQKGRMELLYGDPKVALAHFQRAAELEPDYMLNYSIFREGVWTYVGRAHYASGRFAEARQALERARSRHADDNLAKLYLGLALGRDGNQQRGLKEIEAGLMGLADWLEFIEYYHSDGRYWDPTKKIRGESRRNLAMVKGREVNWKDLIENVEWIGKEIEQEIDLAARDKSEDQVRESERADQP